MPFARDDGAVRCGLRAVFFVLAAIQIVLATIIIATPSRAGSAAIPDSARNSRPAAAKRRFAGGNSAQSQSEQTRCRQGQGVYRRRFVRDETSRRVRGGRAAAERDASREPTGPGWGIRSELGGILAREGWADPGCDCANGTANCGEKRGESKMRKRRGSSH